MRNESLEEENEDEKAVLLERELSAHKERNEIFKTKKDSYLAAFLVILKTMVGTGIFTLPYFGSNAGSVFIALFCLVLTWGYNYLGAFYYVWTYEINEENGKVFSSSREASEIAFGWLGELLDFIVTGATITIVIAAYISLLDGQLQDYFCYFFYNGQSDCVSENYFAFFSASLVLIQALTINRSFSYEFFGKISSFFLGLIVLTLIYYSTTSIVQDGAQPAFLSSDISLRTFSLCLVGCLYANEQNLIMLTFRFDFTRRSLIPMMHCTYDFVLVLLGIVMFLCAFAVGTEDLSDVIYDNFDTVLIKVLVFFYVFSAILFCPIGLFMCTYPIEHSVKFLSLPESSRMKRRLALRAIYPLISLLMAFFSNSLSQLITFWSGLFAPIITLAYPALLYYGACRVHKVPYSRWSVLGVVLLWVFLQVFSLLGSYYSYF